MPRAGAGDQVAGSLVGRRKPGSVRAVWGSEACTWSLPGKGMFDVQKGGSMWLD